VPAGSPPLVKLPPPLQSAFYLHASGEPVTLGKYDITCTSLNLPLQPIKCLGAGVGWECPSGFKVDPAAAAEPSSLPICRPRTDVCGAGPLLAAPATGGAIHVDVAASGSGADGSVVHPFPTLAAAVAAAPAHATILVAQGAYPGLFTTPSAASSPSSRLASFVLAARCGAPLVRLAALLRARPRFASQTELSRRSLVNNPGYAAGLNLNKPVTLRGRCPKLTTIFAADGPMLTVGLGADVTVTVRDLRIAGPGAVCRCRARRRPRYRACSSTA
jgi:hypothetical protein